MQWHDLRGPDDPELDRLAQHYKLHPLHVEDCRHRNQAAKIEENENYIFVVLKPIEVEPDGSLEISDLDLFAGPDFLITVQEAEQPAARQLLDQVRAAAPQAGPAHLLYRIMDGIVDSYLPVIDRFNEAIDQLEDAVLENPSPAALARIFATKRGLIELRRVLANTRDVANHVQRIERSFSPDLRPFFRDVYDHLARNLDMVEMQRDLLTGALDIYLSSVGNRTNQVMKVLTVLGTIALPVLVVSSFYGMNVKPLPWADSPHGTAIVAAIILAGTALLLGLLKFFGWL